MNKIKEIEKKIKDLEAEKKKLEETERDERIKIGLDAFGSKLIEFKQSHSYFVSNKKLTAEIEEFITDLEVVLKTALEKQWKYFEDREKKHRSYVKRFFNW